MIPARDSRRRVAKLPSCARRKASLDPSSLLYALLSSSTTTRLPLRRRWPRPNAQPAGAAAGAPALADAQQKGTHRSNRVTELLTKMREGRAR